MYNEVKKKGEKEIWRKKRYIELWTGTRLDRQGEINGFKRYKNPGETGEGEEKNGIIVTDAYRGSKGKRPHAASKEEKNAGIRERRGLVLFLYKFVSQERRRLASILSKGGRNPRRG